ncbi:MAG: hypothetical protein JW885_09465 [Deltaproteobacteria bacterium]|nr:hypothetical protein [Candidatus Zymogenaceae bacterium]
MGANRKGSLEPIPLIAVCVFLTLVFGGVVEASESSALSSDWSVIIEITKLLLWSFLISVVLLMVVLIGSAQAFIPLDAGETADTVLFDVIEDIGSMFDTLDRKLLAGHMSRDAHIKARTFLEGRARFDRGGQIIRRKAA